MRRGLGGKPRPVEARLISGTFCPARRSALVAAMLAAGAITASRWSAAGARIQIDNITRLYSVDVAKSVRPENVDELSAAVRAWPGRIAIGGGRYSMGGQIATAGGLHIDMRGLTRIVWCRPSVRAIRVQAGATWRQIQGVIDPHDLSIKIMQSYANFTVGGSVSVNCHGRYVGAGPVGNSVRALKLMLADGSLVEASRTENTELFRAAIGGYGACGVIVEVEIDLVPNIKIKRYVETLTRASYFDHFLRNIARDKTAVMHNADLLPPRFNQAISVTWRETNEALTEPARLIDEGGRYAVEQDAIWLLTEVPGMSSLRKKIAHPLLSATSAVRWRNHEASLDVASLEPRTRRISTYVLQEYFIPCQYGEAFAETLAKTLRLHSVEALNISIRHSPPDKTSALPWAAVEVFSFVVYFKQGTDRAATEKVRTWTRDLISAALSFNGRYYLPYQIVATKTQFEQAYPEIAALRALKARVDPMQRFSNSLWERYL